MRVRINANLIMLCCVMFGSIFFNGCAFFGLKEELKGLQTTYRLNGKLQGDWPRDVSMVAVLYQKEGNTYRIADYVIPDPEGHYSFLLPEGHYLLSVFEDNNQNFIYDDGETFGFANKTRPIALDDQPPAPFNSHLVPNVDIEMTQKTGFPSDLPTIVNINALSGRSYINIGVVTDLDDPRFKEENGTMGYWKPFSFLRDVGAGIYFLENYDPDKIPVLFVHGASGTPAGWKPVMPYLDREKYQPWFFYYPSGLRVGPIASALNAMVRSLDDNYGLKKMVVVAHSMGGLVSRAFILENVIEDQQDYIYKFISISTPWGGVNTAGRGVKNSPVVVPNWIDMAPESQFIQSIYAERLPKQVKFYLLFGVRGKCLPMMGNNDGVIEIASELDYRAQNDARAIFGYNEDHNTIIKCPEMLDRFKALMR